MFCELHFVLSAHAYPGLILGLGCTVGHGRSFQADSSDLSHMGIYMDMGVITGEYGSYHQVAFSSNQTRRVWYVYVKT